MKAASILALLLLGLFLGLAGSAAATSGSSDAEILPVEHEDGDEGVSFSLMRDGPLITEFPSNMTALDVRSGIVKAANAMYDHRAKMKCTFPLLPPRYKLHSTSFNSGNQKAIGGSEGLE